MLLLIAPSKTQNQDIAFSCETSQPQFLKDSGHLIAELRKYSVSDLGSLMKMSDCLADQTRKRIKSFHLPFTIANATPALFSFQGDVYSRIDSKTYGTPELRYIQDHLCILSGLYGILRPLDLMQPYRLEMGCRLINSRGKNLYEFWTDSVTEAINRELAGQKEQVVVNLASKEYSRVVKTKKLNGVMLQVDCKERKGEIYKTIAIHAKRARGLIVDFAVKNKLQSPQELKEFRVDGYRFRKSFSTDNHYVFTRE